MDVFSTFTASPLTAFSAGAGSFFWLLLRKKRNVLENGIALVCSR
jgi:hypothetical protein